MKTAQLRERLTERAVEENLLDVGYATVDSPFGSLLLATTRRGMVRVGLPTQEPDVLLQELSDRVSPRVIEAPGLLDQARRELDLYFEGRLHDFELPLDWQLSRDFRRRALRAVARIPYGQTRSYTEIAARAGNERAVEGGGNGLRLDPIPILVPCHRVLRLGGGLGGYGGGLPMKEALLELEGAMPERPKR